MSLLVGVQMYSVRGDGQRNTYDTLKKIKKYGYDGVEFAGLYDHTADELRSMCEDIGLIPISAHVPYKSMLKDPNLLEEYAKLGCKFTAVPYLSPEDRPGTDGFADLIKNVEMLGVKAKELGMVMLYHNHDFEFVKLDGKYALDVLYDSIPAEFLQTEIDTCWANVGGVVPSEYIMKYKGRAPVVHLKDFYGEKSEDMYELIGIENKAPVRPSGFELRPVGYGLQDFKAILEACEKAGTHWVIVEQDNPSMNLTPMQCIEKSREYLRTLGY